MDIKHGFIKGLNRDISKDKFPRDVYYYLLNGRVLSDDEASLSDIINLKGNSNANINDNGLVRTLYSIIGYTTSGNDIILFYAENTATGVDSYTTTAIIDRLVYTGNDSYSRTQLWSGIGLNFRIDKKIRAISRYESSLVEKIYWTDNNNPLKQANIAEDISGYDVIQFDIIGDMYGELAPQFSDYGSGSLKPGSIAYAYRFVKKNGYKTVFSSVSDIIPIGSNIQYFQWLRRAYGDEIYDPDNAFNTGKGTIIFINILNSNHLDYYDFIEVVSLWYSSSTAIPDINIIAKLELTDATTYRIIDSGTNSYGTLTYAEFLDQSYEFITKDIVSKDNRLFAANINESYFDLDEDATWSGKSPGDFWDSRAYRFDSTRVAELDVDVVTRDEYSINGADPTNAGASPSYVDWRDIPVDANAVNRFNAVSATATDENNTLGNKQRFQLDGTTVGGSGINIEYEFSFTSYLIASTSDTSPAIDGSIQSGDAGKYQLGIYKNFQRDEVYRFGIVFFDKKGRQSFVKWIGDIRIPTIDSVHALTTYNPITDEFSSISLWPVFTVSNRPQIDGEYLDYQIVYVKREEEDKSVVAAGMFMSTLYNVDGSRPAFVPVTIGDYFDNVSPFVNETAAYDHNRLLVNLISPEINFRNTESLNFDFIHINGELISGACVYKDRDAGVDSWSALTCNNGPSTTAHVVYVRKYLGCTYATNESRVAVNAFVKTIPPTSSNFAVVIDVDQYKHYSYRDTGGGDNTASPYGTCFTMRLNGYLTANTGNTHYFYGYARKGVYQTQYGGFTYQDRQVNTYIPASDKVLGTTGTVDCRYGDTFITFFEHGRAFMQQDGTTGTAKSYADINIIAVESSINCLLRTKDTYTRTYFVDATIPGYINEDPYIDTSTGIALDGIYGYNSAYNKLEDSKKFFAKSSLFEEIEQFNARVRYSDLKIDNEDIDSWLNFRANNYRNANESYGQINKLVEFRDKIFSFQNNAVSLISINPRVTQQSQDGVSIILGSGEVIDKFHYITTDVGCQDNSDVIKSFSSLYWLDKNKKKIYTFGEGLESITDVKGIHTYLKNNVNENSTFIGTYDVKNSEVIMTIRDSNPNTIFLTSDLGGGNWSLLGITSIVETPFVIGRVYRISNGWFTYTGKTDTAYFFTYSHGTNLTDATNVDLSAYITERDNFTIAFSEKIDAFSSFYSFLPDLYIYHPLGYFTSQNSRDLWQHDISDEYNNFYGVSYPLTLKIIHSYGAEVQGEFTNLKFFLSMKDVDGNYIRNETLTNISAKNNYQISDDIILYPMHLPEDTNRTKYVLDTSSRRIGRDWYTGLVTPNEGLVVYQNQLYRNTSGGNLATTPGGAGWSVAELCNIRKTIERWVTQLPRIESPENSVDVPMSDRLRSDWFELTLEFKDTVYPVGTEDRRIRISDLVLISNTFLT